MPGNFEERGVQPALDAPPLPLLITSPAAADQTPATPRVEQPGEPTLEPPTGWTDVLTGTEGPHFWDRIVTSEQARNARYGRTSTIALIEIAGVEATANRWGREMALQLFLRLSRDLASGIRSSDFIARVGPTRFGVLLVETDEILAINFVDRIRARCCSELGPERGLRLAIGWASPIEGEHLADAFVLAQERLEADLNSQA